MAVVGCAVRRVSAPGIALANAQCADGPAGVLSGRALPPGAGLGNAQMDQLVAGTAAAGGAELGYLMSKDTGYDVEDCITLATKGLKLRVARRVWRDYYRHSFARQHCADPSTEGLADQQRRRKISEEDSRRDEQERAKNHEFWAWKARNLSAWAPRGMG